jgi:hypothetical protein
MIFEVAVTKCRVFRMVAIDLEHAEAAELMPADKRIGYAREAWEGTFERHTRTTLRLGRKTFCFEVDRPFLKRQAA